MTLVKKGGVEVARTKSPPGKPEQAASGEYVCPHDGASRKTPGPCPTCQMMLDERHRKVEKGLVETAMGSASLVYKCPMDGAVRETPGPCPTCKMPLGTGQESPKEAPPQGERTIYVCDVHPESVSDKPGQCFKDT